MPLKPEIGFFFWPFNQLPTTPPFLKFRQGGGFLFSFADLLNLQSVFPNLVMEYEYDNEVHMYKCS